MHHRQRKLVGNFSRDVSAWKPAKEGEKAQRPGPKIWPYAETLSGSIRGWHGNRMILVGWTRREFGLVMVERGARQVRYGFLVCLFVVYHLMSLFLYVNVMYSYVSHYIIIWCGNDVDVELWNLETGLKDSLEDAYARVSYDGSVWWGRPGNLRPACKFAGLDLFPFDKLSCAMEFGSWTL